MKKQVKTSTILYLIIFTTFIIISTEIYGCTTFCIKDSNNIIFGYNFDWYKANGYIMINKRNVSKVAYMPWEDKPVSWISKFGSITFNAFGKEFPFGGMNEAGLVVAQMQLDNTKYPEMDNRKSLCELQWIQYQLDNSETIDDVIASDKMIRITNYTLAPLHFLVSDRLGNVATIEFLKGRLVYHTGDELPVSLLTNTKYDKSLKSLNKFIAFGEKDVNPTSESRFIKGTYMIKKHRENSVKPIVDYAFGMLDYLKQEHTRWSIVFDANNLQIHYKTFRNKDIKIIKLSEFDFNCNAEDLLLDVDKKFNKVQDNFEKYTTEKNRNLIFSNSNLQEGFKNISNEFWEQMAKYPESLECKK